MLGDLSSVLITHILLFQHLGINASIFTLVIIALDRYRGIIWPLKGGYSKHRAKIIVLFIWIVSIAPAIPNLLVFHVSIFFM